MTVDKVYLFEVDQIDCLLKEYLPIKSPFGNAKLLSMMGKILVQTIVYQDYGINIEKQQYCTGKYGKPYLTNLIDFHYNISHTEGVIVIGVSNTPIGIDIEKIQSNDLAIAKRFFTQNEQKYLLSQSKDEQNRRFCQIWTSKESYLKYLGIGLSGLLSIDVLTPQVSKQLMTICWKRDYILTICRRDNCLPISLVEVGPSMLDNLLPIAGKYIKQSGND